MKFSTKILIGSGLLLNIILGYTLTFGESKEIPQKSQTKQSINYEEAEKIAQEFITANIGNEFWKDEVPTLGDGTPMYMEKDIPSYIEYEMLCKKENGCGFVLINLDGDDVEIPSASYSGIPPSQILINKSNTSKENLQFYFFSPFSIYSQNQENGEIHAIDPQIDPVEKDEVFPDMSDGEKEVIQKIIQEKKTEVAQIFDDELQTTKKFKQSDHFQQFKQNKPVKKETSYSPTSNNWTYIPGYTTSECDSYVPCYKQYFYLYYTLDFSNQNPSGTRNCASGCSPVAAGMILGYHDRHNFPNLIPGTAPLLNTHSTSTNIRNTIAEVRGYMGTFCYKKQPNTPSYLGSTDLSGIKTGFYYAQLQGYNNSGSYMIESNDPYTMFDFVKNNVNIARPMIVHFSTPGGHSVVAYGYKADTSSGYKIKVNLGWGPYNNAAYEVNLSSSTFLPGNYTVIAGGNTFYIQ